MDNKELLEKRRLLKKKKPEFIRQDAHKKKKVGWKWRKPKGSDSKMRVGKKGFKRSVKIGWGSPSLVKGLDRQGMNPVIVNNLHDLELINLKTDVAVIAKGVGTRKKMEIVQQAITKNIIISNIKEPEKFVEETKKQFESKKKAKEKIKESRKKKKDDAKKEAEKKKEKEKKAKKEEDSKEEPEMTEAEKKNEEKKERDKLLISTE